MYFTTSSVGPRLRAASWQEVIRANCGHFDADFGNLEPNGAIETATIGDLPCAKISQSICCINRSANEICEDKPEHCFLVLQGAGDSTIISDRNVIAMVPGDAVLIDSAMPFRMTMTGKTSQTCVHVPKDYLAGKMQEWESRLACKLPAPSNYLIQSIVAAAFVPGDGVGAQSGSVLAEAIVGLLASSWIGDFRPSSEGHPSERLRDVRNFIVNNLGEEDLSPRMIAAATGVSERQLYRLFADGPSLSQWIRQVRLDQCAADFRNPSLRDRTITEVAYARGFNDSAHFSRVFRDVFGVSPREYRKQIARAH